MLRGHAGPYSDARRRDDRDFEVLRPWRPSRGRHTPVAAHEARRRDIGQLRAYIAD